ncbi:MAG TPA: hypothetical protein VIY86_07195, partial [Pirellulaceae bacterium]
MSFGKCVVVLGITLGIGSLTWADLPQTGDVVMGLSRSVAAETMDLVRGPQSLNGGTVVPDIWNTSTFIQSVEFDNLGGVRHNGQGNLLGANFGNIAAGCAPCGGTLHNFSTTNMGVGAGQLLYDFTGTFGNSVTLTRWGGLSVSPLNNRVALVGSDAQTVVVFNYTAGDTMGANGAVTNGRETTPGNIVAATTGTTWIDNDTVLVFDASGVLFEVDASVQTSPMPMNQVGNLATAFVGSNFTSLAYNPAESPYVFA